MPTLKIKAIEMTAAQVDRISLVPRGATRMPFKVLKEEKPMSFLSQPLDLARVGNAFKRDKEPTVSLMGVATMKSDKTPVVKAAIEAAGFLVSKEEDMGDGTVAFAQVDNPEFNQDDVTVIRMNDDVAIALKGFRPWNVDMTVEGGASFADLCKAQGFYPGVRTIMEVLQGAVIHTAEQGENPAAAAKAVGTLFDEVKAYVVGLVSALPGKAFKLEYVGDETEAEPAEPAVAADPAATPAVKTEDAPKVVEAPAVKADEAPESAAAPAVAAPAAPAVVALPDELTAALKGMTAMSESFGKVVDQVAGIAKKLESVDSSFQELSDRVVKAEKVAETAHAAVEGTVVLGGAGGGDRESVQKQEGNRGGREVDTAFAPRRRR